MITHGITSIHLPLVRLVHSSKSHQLIMSHWRFFLSTDPDAKSSNGRPLAWVPASPWPRTVCSTLVCRRPGLGPNLTNTGSSQCIFVWSHPWNTWLSMSSGGGGASSVSALVRGLRNTALKCLKRLDVCETGINVVANVTIPCKKSSLLFNAR